MSKKKLDTERIRNELEQSAFFPGSTPPSKAKQMQPKELRNKPLGGRRTEQEQRKGQTQRKDTLGKQKVVQKKNASAETSVLAPELARYQASLIEAIRTVVRVGGKEVAFVRLTEEEKQRLGDVVYSYKRQGIKSSENELLRIGLVFLLDDYKENGKESVLDRVITALNS